MKLPNYENAIVTEEKIRDYILNDNHIDGGNKSIFFQKIGFERSKWKLLRDALLLHCKENDVLNTIETNYGTKYIVEGELTSPDGRNPNVRTIWFIANNEKFPKFITAYPI